MELHSAIAEPGPVLPTPTPTPPFPAATLDASQASERVGTRSAARPRGDEQDAAELADNVTLDLAVELCSAVASGA